MSDALRLRLASRVRLKRDAVRGGVVLLAPETVVELNEQGAEVLSLCDGTRSRREVILEMQRRSGHTSGKVEGDVEGFIERVLQRGWLEQS
jgi:pyrroloquinoline quinone biosynthesis protein D